MIFYVKITGYDIKKNKDVSKTIAVQVQGYDYNTAADVALFEANSMGLTDVVADTIKATKIHVVHAQKSEGYTGWYLVSFDDTETQWAELYEAYDMRELQVLIPDRGRDMVYAHAIKREKIAAYVSIETYEHDPQYKQAMHQWHIKQTLEKTERLSAEISEKLGLD